MAVMTKQIGLGEVCRTVPGNLKCCMNALYVLLLLLYIVHLHCSSAFLNQYSQASILQDFLT